MYHYLVTYHYTLSSHVFATIYYAPLHIDRAEVEKVSCFKFLCVFIKDELTWSIQADSAVKTAQKCLYFLRRLKKFGMSAKTLTNFYRCTIESILSGCVTAWFGSCSTADRKALQRVLKTIESSPLAAGSQPCKAHTMP